MTIAPEDQKFLKFLFYTEGVDREAGFCLLEGRFLGYLHYKTMLYLILYPIMFIWEFCRFIKYKIWRKIQ